jgi:hypothetical protein
MAATVEALINQALRRIAYQVPIGTIWEGSPASRVALEVYGQTRDALLNNEDWPFARQAVGLRLLKTAPVGGYSGLPWSNAYPPPPWIYEYAYPDACITIRSVRPTPIIMPEFDPRPHIFVLANDNSLNPPAKVVLTNLANAQAVITGQITDPLSYEAGFTDALVAALALRLQEALSPDATAIKDRAAEAQTEMVMANERRG